MTIRPQQQDESFEPSAPSLSADHYRRQLETVANNATVALFVMDEHQQCSYMNPAAERLTGFSLAEVHGRALHDVIHHTRPDGTPYPLSECPIDQAFPENNQEQGEEVFVHRDGSFYHVAYTASPIRENGVPVGTIIEVRDISAEKQSEAERVEWTQQLRDLADAALAINANLSLDETIRITTESARRIVGAHQSVTSMTTNENWAQAITAVDVSDMYAEWSDYDTPPDGSGIYALVCETNSPMRMTQAELEAHPRWRGFGADADIHPPMRGWLAAPLIGRDGQNLGLIQLSDKEVGEFTESDEAILIQLAQLASVAIENARLYEETEAAVAARERFLALASHELKTPLTSIKGISQLLSRRLAQSPPDTERAVTFASQLEQQIRRLETLVADLLDISRIQQGRLDLQLASVDLTEIARAVVERFEPPQDQRDRWSLALDTPSPVVGMWDAARLDQVLTNLVSNAIKYSPDGGTVTLSVAGDNGSAMVRVIDQGIGIPQAEQATLFEPFVRGARASGVAGGDGLGLHISAQIVAQHGGTIAVDSTPGEGSTFTVLLPTSASIR